jgi:hypothetical protein
LDLADFARTAAGDSITAVKKLLWAFQFHLVMVTVGVVLRLGLCFNLGWSFY